MQVQFSRVILWKILSDLMELKYLTYTLQVNQHTELMVPRFRESQLPRCRKGVV